MQTFGINLTLTLLGWIPGLVHAIYVMFIVDDAEYEEIQQGHQQTCTIIKM
jgi:hypothetical protein